MVYAVDHDTLCIDYIDTATGVATFVSDDVEPAELDRICDKLNKGGGARLSPRMEAAILYGRFGVRPMPHDGYWGDPLPMTASGVVPLAKDLTWGEQAPSLFV